MWSGAPPPRLPLSTPGEPIPVRIMPRIITDVPVPPFEGLEAPTSSTGGIYRYKKNYLARKY